MHLMGNAQKYSRNNMTKTILCYGDSNTHGKAPETGLRHQFSVRWPGVLQQKLGERARVVEEGLNGRTTVYDEPIRNGRNGAEYLPVLVESHAPIDILILMLGTNDVLGFFDVTAHDAARGASRLVDLARSTCARIDYSPPAVLLISPPVALPLSGNTKNLCPGDPSKSLEFAPHYKAVARAQNCLFLDASKIVETSEIDGIHLDAQNHHKLGLAIAECLQDAL
jgi:lysophospholipase L1-like esterase